jgi:hypothetical protein
MESLLLVLAKSIALLLFLGGLGAVLSMIPFGNWNLRIPMVANVIEIHFVKRKLSPCRPGMKGRLNGLHHSARDLHRRLLAVDGEPNADAPYSRVRVAASLMRELKWLAEKAENGTLVRMD